MKTVAPFHKPKGITSSQFVGRVRRLVNGRKVGHGGALDPLAEGVLILGFGREGTKQLANILKNETKEYEAVIRLGAVSETYDSEGPITENPNFNPPAGGQIPKQTIEEVLKKFVGEIEQVPPVYSAVKVNGQRAYALARAGKTPALKPRPVFIEKIEILDYAPPDLFLRIICGSGVYIRSLAHDLGQALGVGAYLKELKRTRVGHWVLADAMKLEDLEKNPDILNDV